MLEITPDAQTAVKTAMEEKNLTQPLRVYLGGGCGGYQLLLGLDELRESDHSIDLDGYTYVVDQELAGQMGELKVDFIDDGIRKGFLITSENPLPEAPSCGSGCSCGE